jgi:hypothetical protein
MHLGVLMKARGRAMSDPHRAREIAADAGSSARALLDCALAWMLEPLDLAKGYDGHEQLPAAEARDAIVETLSHGLPLLQHGLRGRLMMALRALNGGQVEDILAPAKVGRRRALPYTAAECELRMLMWIRFEKGKGRRVSDAEMDVARVVGVSPKVFTDWRRELPKVFGRAKVERLLQIAEAVGEAADNPGWTTDRSGNPILVNGRPLLWTEVAMVPRDLGPIAERLKGARRKRREPG